MLQNTVMENTINTIKGQFLNGEEMFSYKAFIAEKHSNVYRWTQNLAFDVVFATKYVAAKSPYVSRFAQ